MFGKARDLFLSDTGLCVIVCLCFASGYVNGKIYIQIYLSILRERPLAAWCSHLIYKRRGAEEDYTRLAALSTGETHF